MIDQGLNINEIAKNINLNSTNIKAAFTDELKLAKLNKELQSKFKQDLFSEKTTEFVKIFNISDNNYIMYQINNITVERYLTIDEIKGKLLNKWQNHKNIEQNKEIANNIYDLLSDSQNKLNSLAQLKEKYKLIVKKEFINQKNDKLAVDFKERIFTLNKDKKVTKPILSADRKYFLFALYHFKRVKNTDPAERKFLSSRLTEIYQQHFNNSVFNAYLNFLIKKHQVEIKQSDN